MEEQGSRRMVQCSALLGWTYAARRRPWPWSFLLLLWLRHVECTSSPSGARVPIILPSLGTLHAMTMLLPPPLPSISLAMPRVLTWWRYGYHQS
uniref:Secreted protein n=1 Tax=Arundo donax TaxID=35708 RepID=A0A0A9FBX0_ARUDO